MKRKKLIVSVMALGLICFFFIAMVAKHCGENPISALLLENVNALAQRETANWVIGKKLIKRKIEFGGSWYTDPSIGFSIFYPNYIRINCCVDAGNNDYACDMSYHDHRC